MSNRSVKNAPVVRLPPKSNTEVILARGAQVAMVGVGFVALIFALQAGEFILAPIFLAVVVGLMFGPLATRIEHYGVPPMVSAAFVVLLFIGLVAAVLLGLGITVVAEAVDPKVRGARDVRDLLSVSPLVAIPTIRNSRSKRKSAWRFAMATAGAAVGVWVAFTAIQGFI